MTAIRQQRIWSRPGSPQLSPHPHFEQRHWKLEAARQGTSILEATSTGNSSQSSKLSGRHKENNRWQSLPKSRAPKHCNSRDIVVTVNATALVPFVPVSQNVEQHQEVDRSTTHLHHTLTEQALSKKLLHFNNLTIVVFRTNFIFMKTEASQQVVLCQRSQGRSINTGLIPRGKTKWEILLSRAEKAHVVKADLFSDREKHLD